MQVKNYISGGEIRCLQSVFRMVVQTLVGHDPGQQAADEMTGYVEGRGTWQFDMMLALAGFGLNVIDHEQLDAQEFVDDPEAAIRRQVNDEAAIQGILAETDIEAERKALKRCLASDRIQLIDAVPTLADLEKEIAQGRLVLCPVDLKVLRQKEKREGHLLIVEAMDEETITVHDPGPVGGLGIAIPLQLFHAAWTSPAETMANLISVWKDQG
jgi:hypothetical protein